LNNWVAKGVASDPYDSVLHLLLFLSLLLPCQVQDGQEKTKEQSFAQTLYFFTARALSVIASCHGMLHQVLGGSFVSSKFFTIDVD
jgi:hypothetical protein